MAKVESFTAARIEKMVGVEGSLASCAVGPLAPVLDTGRSALWIDTSGGTFGVLKLVVGD